MEERPGRDEAKRSLYRAARGGTARVTVKMNPRRGADCGKGACDAVRVCRASRCRALPRKAAPGSVGALRRLSRYFTCLTSPALFHMHGNRLAPLGAVRAMRAVAELQRQRVVA